jgi:radical SAM enzyme (TIGR01210 family)
VVFLTNRECPFRCVMCDLWINTLDRPVPRGAIPAQIRAALAHVPASAQIKLYNAGSFFDPRAIPPADDEAIAETAAGFDRVIVEAHPAFLAGRHGERCLRFRDRLRGRLEVAVGLETAHPGVLARLNKRMTLDSFSQAARFLRDHDIDLRVFVLLNPPFLPADEGVEWACRSLDMAAARGAVACSIIPTRDGNGAIEALRGQYSRPTLSALETAVEYGLSLDRMRVFADLWEIERFFDCACSPARARRLGAMNRTQLIGDRVRCACGDGGGA